MSPSKLGVFASLALAASAVLIPPTITAEDLGDDNAMEIAINPFKRSFALECPGCAFATKEGETLKWKPDAGNTFLLDFEVGSLENTLGIDGYQLYPPSPSYSTESFHVTQIDPTSEEALRLRVTGYQFRFNGAESISEAGVVWFPLTIQITSVEGTTVDPPALDINVIKDAEGRLMIASFHAEQPSEATPIDQEKECNEWPLLCKWKSVLADRIAKMKKTGKGCHNRPQGDGHNNLMAEETTKGKPPHVFRPGMPHHRPHHMGHEGHHHHHPHHRFQKFIRRAFFTILIPILIGIFAGTLTYLIGMALGCLIAITIAKFRGQRYQRIALEEDVESGESLEVPVEKEEYAELPAYDDPPVYEEAAEKEVNQEAK